jgi:hypothetical protein
LHKIFEAFVLRAEPGVQGRDIADFCSSAKGLERGDFKRQKMASIEGGSDQIIEILKVCRIWVLDEIDGVKLALSLRAKRNREPGTRLGRVSQISSQTKDLPVPHNRDLSAPAGAGEAVNGFFCALPCSGPGA